MTVSKDNSGLVRIGKRPRSRPDDCSPRAPKRKALGSVLPLLKALSDENRLGILELLLGADGELCACEIEEAFKLSQPTISHHMKVLREAGLVDGEKRGLWVYYSPTPAARAMVEALIVAARR